MTAEAVREVVIRCPAKVNLLLRVGTREASGYHRIETLFQGLALHDRVRLRPRGDTGVALRVDGDEELGPADENLAVRAARAYRARAGLERAAGLEVHLEKTIAAGAGLGGGSSDAAAVLRALDRLHEGAVGRPELLDLAAELGADVPFFLGERTLALGRGRGERLLGLPPLPERAVVVAVPPFRVSTTAAYEGLDRRREEGPDPATARARLPDPEHLDSWEGVAAVAENDFEEWLFAERPLARDLRDALAGCGAAPALVSGSGSALFGVYESEEDADAATSRIQSSFRGVRAHRTRTLGAWPEPEVR